MPVRIIFPPRPKGKILPSDLPFHEQSGKWLAQRKFRGSRAVIHISSDKNVTLGNRHGATFARFSLSKDHCGQFLDGLHLQSGVEYWFDGELMNKDQDSTNEIILFDILQAGRYFFNSPTQEERLTILSEICGNPTKICSSGIALEVTPKIWLAQVFSENFVERFTEALPNKQLEGLVLRKKKSPLDNFGQKLYETANLVRCRKPFAIETPKEKRSGGYEF